MWDLGLSFPSLKSLVLVLRWFQPFIGKRGGLFFLWGVDSFAEEVTTLWTLLSSDRRLITSLLLDVIVETSTYCVCCLSLPCNFTHKIARVCKRGSLSSLAKFIQFYSHIIAQQKIALHCLSKIILESRRCSWKAKNHMESQKPW
jgi:hypothetical protein